MLRITSALQTKVPTLMLEGSLTAAELPLLEASIRGARAAEVVLDLSGLRWIDEVSTARLQELRSAGAWLTACSPFIARLLAKEAR